jgi:hypothetical protein
VVGKPATQDNQRNEVNHMETILTIEVITLCGVFTVGTLFWVTTEIMDYIKKYKKEKTKKNFDSLDKF